MSNSKTTFSDNMVQGIPWMIISKLLLFMIYFLVSVITVRSLGTADYGLYVLCKSIAEVLILVCTLGMTASFTRYVPELVAKRNRAGLERLVSKAFVLQLGAVLLLSTLLIAGQSWLEKLFDAALGPALLVVCVMAAFELTKNNINTLLTALYKIKALCMLSITHGILWVTLLAALLSWQGSVESALLAPTVSYACVYIIAALVIYRRITQLPWKSPLVGIGRQRVLKHSGSVAITTLIRLMMLKYTELFFLGIVHDTSTVGMYDLAYSIPLMVIVFIPAAIQDLFASGFSETYVKDNNSLPQLIRSYYKALILLSVPLAILGYFTAPGLFSLIYGAEMSLAGELAALFCLFHILPLISVPLSLAIQAKEKTHSMLPTLLLQFAVNVLLDYLLIVHFSMGIWGAFYAVLLTFLITIPVRLYRVRQLIGGLYIPVGFFSKIATISTLCGFAASSMLDTYYWGSVVVLCLIYCLVVSLICLKTSLLSARDRQDLQMVLSARLIARMQTLRERLISLPTLHNMNRRISHEES